MFDPEALDAFQNVALNKMIFKMFANDDSFDLEKLKAVVTTFNKHGVNTLTLMGVVADLLESGALNEF
jgi:hypothetical protein